MTYVVLFLITVSLALLSTVFYRAVNKGLSSSSKHQQLTRLSIASVIAVLPWAIAGKLPLGIPVLLMGVVCVIIVGV